VFFSVELIALRRVFERVLEVATCYSLILSYIVILSDTYISISIFFFFIKYIYIFVTLFCFVLLSPSLPQALPPDLKESRPSATY